MRDVLVLYARFAKRVHQYALEWELEHKTPELETLAQKLGRLIDAVALDNRIALCSDVGHMIPDGDIPLGPEALKRYNEIVALLPA